MRDIGDQVRASCIIFLVVIPLLQGGGVHLTNRFRVMLQQCFAETCLHHHPKVASFKTLDFLHRTVHSAAAKVGCAGWRMYKVAKDTEYAVRAI